MPEAAEVELTRKGLEEFAGLRIAELDVRDPKLAIHGSSHEVEGLPFVGSLRHGKLLGLELESGLIEVHLRLTGRFALDGLDQARFVITFEDGQHLGLIDSRRFATARLISELDFAEGLGPDLFDGDFAQWPPERSLKSRRAIKGCLLDQKLVAGIGNYIVDEALWRERVNPATPGKELDADRWRRLLEAARSVAEEALARGGMTMRDYLAPSGEAGTMQDSLDVYGRRGSPCRRCSETLVAGEVAGRGTTWCPRCQPDIT